MGGRNRKGVITPNISINEHSQTLTGNEEQVCEIVGDNKFALNNILGTGEENESKQINS